MKEIKLERQIYRTNKETTAVYIAVLNGEKCHAIVHKESGFTAVFDYDKRIWGSMKRLMREKGYSLFYDKDPSGLPRFRFVTKTCPRSHIDLRQFLWARYNKRYLASVQGRVSLRTDDRAGNFCDLRHNNIYLAGDLDNRDDIIVRLTPNPKDENEKWIEVVFNEAEPFTEYAPYTAELLEMLTTPRYARLGTITNGRGKVAVDGYSTLDDLARFICVYKKYFPLYQGKRNAVQKFIHDYRRLSELEKDKHAAHINSYFHEHTFDNLIFMESTTNQAMSDYIKWLADGYNAYTAVNDRDEILLEFTTPFRESPQYVKFETPEDYADFQRVFIYGTKLSKKMQAVIYPTPEGLTYRLTPIGMRAAGIVNRDTVNARELDFWTDREHKDKLLSLPDEAFKVYHREALETARVIRGVPLPEDMEKGDKVFFSIDGGGIMTVELVKVGRKKVGKEDGTVTASER